MAELDVEALKRHAKLGCCAELTEQIDAIITALEDRERLREAIHRADRYKSLVVEGGLTGPDPGARPGSYVLTALHWENIVELAALEGRDG